MPKVRRLRRWFVLLAFVIALLGPAFWVVGPDGAGSAEEYVPVGLFVLMLFTPAFPFGVYVLPQFLAYFAVSYLIMRAIAKLRGSRRAVNSARSSGPKPLSSNVGRHR
jgi:hypothetical protein